MRFAAARPALLVCTALWLAACGGGGGGAGETGATVPPPSASSTSYSNSVLAGVAGTQTLLYTQASGTRLATLTSPTASILLTAGTTPAIAEHREAALPGLVIVCVSGRGDSTNVVTGINLGVIVQSVAVLMDTRWSAVDSIQAWAAATAARISWTGWENCGAKPEGLPSRSSVLTASGNGGYLEDVFDGNPLTTFTTLRQVVGAGQVSAMLSNQGLLTTEDPLRPLRLTLRAYADAAGHVVLVQTGAPVAGAPADARGFIALYVPT